MMLFVSNFSERLLLIRKVFIAWIAGFRMGFDDPNEESVVYRKADLDEDTESEDVWDDSALIKMYDEMVNRTYDSLGAQSTSTTKKKKKSRKTSKIKWHVGDHCMAPYYNDQLWYPAVVKKLDLDDGKCDVLYDVYDELARVSIADLTKRLRMRPSVPRMGKRQGWLSFSHFSTRPTNYGNGQQQQQSQKCHKYKTKRYHPDYINVMQMERGNKRRKKDHQTFAIFSNNAIFERNVAFHPSRTVYVMRMLDNLRHQKPVDIDEEGISEGNTIQETFDTEEKVAQINHTQTATKHRNCAQSSSVDQHNSIPSLVPPPPIAFTSLPPPDDDEALASMLMSWYMTGYHTGYYQVKLPFLLLLSPSYQQLFS
uniref:Tudor domain-containing protein n=1 Tax=Elaeophora elaphi TaxID=1147741 RepID=A0A0R3RI00_9BILA